MSRHAVGDPPGPPLGRSVAPRGPGSDGGHAAGAPGVGPAHPEALVARTIAPPALAEPPTLQTASPVAGQAPAAGPLQRS